MKPTSSGPKNQVTGDESNSSASVATKTAKSTSSGPKDQAASDETNKSSDSVVTETANLTSSKPEDQPTSVEINKPCTSSTKVATETAKSGSVSKNQGNDEQDD